MICTRPDDGRRQPAACYKWLLTSSCSRQRRIVESFEVRCPKCQYAHRVVAAHWDSIGCAASERVSDVLSAQADKEGRDRPPHLPLAQLTTPASHLWRFQQKFMLAAAVRLWPWRVANAFFTWRRVTVTSILAANGASTKTPRGPRPGTCRSNSVLTTCHS
jgi:hypothetical protein